jgi:protein-disulfide isomerase
MSSQESSKVNQARTARQKREAAEQAEAKKRRRMWQLGGVLAFVALVVIVVVATSGGGSKAKVGDSQIRAEATKVNNIFKGIPQEGTLLGKSSAPVTLTDYVDLRCPGCNVYSREILPTVIKKYVRTGKLRLDMRLWLLNGHEDFLAPTLYAFAAAKQNQMWQFVDLFNKYAHTDGANTPVFLHRLVKAMPGINLKALTSEASSQESLAAVERIKSEAEQAGLKATPTFLISKRDGSDTHVLELGNNLNKEEFLNKIEAEIKKAQGK